MGEKMTRTFFKKSNFVSHKTVCNDMKISCLSKLSLYTLKNAGLFQPKFMSNMDKPKCWVKILNKEKLQLKVKG